MVGVQVGSEQWALLTAQLNRARQAAERGAGEAIDMAVDPEGYAESQAALLAFESIWGRTVGRAENVNRTIEAIEEAFSRIEAERAAIAADGVITPEELVRLGELEDGFQTLKEIADEIRLTPEERELQAFVENLEDQTRFGMEQAIGDALNGDFQGGSAELRGHHKQRAHPGHQLRRGETGVS